MALTDLKSELLQQILKEVRLCHDQCIQFWLLMHNNCMCIILFQLPVLLGDAHHFQEALNEQAARFVH